MNPQPLAISLLLASLVACALAACGGGRTFSAAEFIDEANAYGASLILGESLDTTRDSAEIYAVGVAPPGGGPAAAAGGGSLTVAADADAGLAEYERCESTGALLCYRASNVALLLEDELTPKQLADLEQAFHSLASD